MNPNLVTIVEDIKLEVVDTASVVKAFTGLQEKYPDAIVEFIVEFDTNKLDFRVSKVADKFIISVYQHKWY